MTNSNEKINCEACNRNKDDTVHHIIEFRNISELRVGRMEDEVSVTLITNDPSYDHIYHGKGISFAYVIDEMFLVNIAKDLLGLDTESYSADESDCDVDENNREIFYIPENVSVTFRNYLQDDFKGIDFYDVCDRFKRKKEYWKKKTEGGLYSAMRSEYSLPIQ